MDFLSVFVLRVAKLVIFLLQENTEQLSVEVLLFVLLLYQY
ncbi:MAG: hypothetical protein ACD_21C00276G0004 [uncultured bacterium]|nr:MAG: hypothetical protein ACD_21C00276G0004 [uncultured bacterium]